MQVKYFDYLPEDAVFIRNEVFIKEQGFVCEFDEIDKSALHLVCYDGENPIATCRIFYDTEKGAYMFGRVAVLKSYRGTGTGSVLLQEAENYVRSQNEKRIVLSAQFRAAGFYEKNGYEKRGDIYTDEDCLHIRMEKVLQ